MTIKRIAFVVGAIALVAAGALGWWLLSPLFINQTVNEELPFSAAAVVPAEMTAVEVEEIMAAMAKMEQPVEEAMPEMPAMPAPTSLKTGMFRDADRFHQGSGSATLYPPR